MPKRFIGVILVLNVAMTVAADDDNVTTTDVQPVDAVTIEESTNGDSMTEFLAVIANVSTTDVTETTNTAGKNYRRHLGLGFTHGMANINVEKTHTVQGTDTVNISHYIYGTGSTNVNPQYDACNGNGHTGNISSGNGNTNNGFGRTDCGDPSPSD